MKSEDWIDIRKQKPETGQIILVRYSDGTSTRFEYASGTYTFLHWQPWADPPITTPFAQWWDSLNGYFHQDHRRMAEDCWNAGVKWAGQEKAKE